MRNSKQIEAYQVQRKTRRRTAEPSNSTKLTALRALATNPLVLRPVVVGVEAAVRWRLDGCLSGLDDDNSSKLCHVIRASAVETGRRCCWTDTCVRVLSPAKNNYERAWFGCFPFF